MYSSTHNYVTFFANEKAKHTEKMFVGKVSEAFKTGEVDEQGRDVYSHEKWDARFVGSARAKAETLNNKDRITLTKWAARRRAYTVTVNGEEKKRYADYLLVFDFELRDAASAGDAGEQNSLPGVPEMGNDYALLEDDDAQLPF